MNARILTVTLAVVVAACEQTKPGGGGGSSGAEVEVTGGDPALPIDHPAVNAPPEKTSADVQRLSIHQLERSISAVLGSDANGNPITWMLGTTAGFDRYGPTLGEADFINVTEDNLEPSALYLKFAGDMARDVCNRALIADAARTHQPERVVIRFAARTDTVQTNAAGVDENLRYLKLRFHGVKLASDDVSAIAPLRTLFDTAVAKAANGAVPNSAHVQTGWHAVCVALLTDPEFHLY